MTETKTQANETMPLNLAARALRVPAGWLREEIETGRVPGLVADRAILVHLPTVAAQLAERAARGEGVPR
jgi:hypothetical protein